VTPLDVIALIEFTVAATAKPGGGQAAV